MAFVPASNVLQVEVRGTYNGEEVECVQYHQHTGAITAPEVDDLFDFYESDFLPAWLNELNVGLSIDELYATDLTSSSSPTYSRAISPPVVGVNSSPALPGNIAACISFRSVGRGRSSRGRNYVPGLGESEATGNLLDLSTVNALVAAYELFLGGGSYPVAWTWAIVSRFFAGSPRVAALVQTVVDVLSTSITVDSQRGRLN